MILMKLVKKSWWNVWCFGVKCVWNSWTGVRSFWCLLKNDVLMLGSVGGHTLNWGMTLTSYFIYIIYNIYIYNYIYTHIIAQPFWPWPSSTAPAEPPKASSWQLGWCDPISLVALVQVCHITHQSHHLSSFRRSSKADILLHRSPKIGTLPCCGSVLFFWGSGGTDDNARLLSALSWRQWLVQ